MLRSALTLPFPELGASLLSFFSFFLNYELSPNFITLHFVRFRGHIQHDIKKTFPTIFIAIDWLEFVNFVLAEFVYAQSMNIMMKCYTAFFVFMMLNTLSGTFVKLT